MSNSHVTNSPAKTKVITRRVTDKFFMIMGQSNAIGQGIFDAGLDTPQDGIHQLALNYDIATAQDPLDNHALEVSTTMGFSMTFAKEYLANNPTERITLVLCAQSGTSIGGLGGWQAGGGVYTKAVASANKMREYNIPFGGVLWHQGESDSQASISGDYATNLSDLVTRFRNDVDGDNSSVPFIVGTLGDSFISGDSGALPQASREEVNNAIIDAPNNITNCALADLSGLALQDVFHFSASSLRTAGVRYYNAYATL